MAAKKTLRSPSQSESGPALAPSRPHGEVRGDPEGEAGQAGRAVGRHATCMKAVMDGEGAKLSNEEHNLLSAAYRKRSGAAGPPEGPSPA